ncbi:MAG TPA: hypothetical protein VFP50_10810 [Anaeromyxobacteraceae bacterium]|nr:hypothetical protein [Anaeromyxobacteraceae bacterium]
MKLDAGSAGAVAAAVLVPVVMRGLARLFPDRAPETTVASLEELRARYQRWELGLGFGVLAACAPVGYLLWLALRGVAAVHAALLPPAELRWLTAPYYWAVPAVLLAIALTIPLSGVLERRLLGARHGEYLAYQRLRTGMDVARVGRLMGGLFGLLCAVVIFLGLDWGVELRPDGLVVNSYLGVGEARYAYGEIVALRTAPALIAPNGNLVHRREYVVELTGGRRWSTNDVLSETSDDEKRDLVERLAARSGARLEEVEVLRNEEL